MDTLLLVLAASSSPLRPSTLADITRRPATSVRATLQRLAEVGLVESTRVASVGPIGTYEWRATEAGRAAVADVLAFVRRGT